MSSTSPGTNLVVCIHEQLVHLCNLCDITRKNFSVRKFWCIHRTQFPRCKICANLHVFPPLRDFGFPVLKKSGTNVKNKNVRAAGSLLSTKKGNKPKKSVLLICEHNETAHLCKKCSRKAAIDCKCIHKKYPSKCANCKGLVYSPCDLDQPEAFTESETDDQEGSDDSEEVMEVQPTSSKSTEADFQLVSRKRKTSSSQPNSPSKTPSKKVTVNIPPPKSVCNLGLSFKLLQEEKDVEAKLTPPPIFISQVTNPHTFKTEIIDKVVKNSKIGIINRTQFKVALENIDDYKKLCTTLKSKKIPYFTHQIKEERATRVVCRGIPIDLPEAEDVVRKTLEEKYKIPIRNVTRMLRNKDKAPLPLMYVDLLPFPESKKMIWEVKEIANLLVRFEKLKPTRNIIQCKNCLALGHSKSYCFREPRCAICSEFHPTGDCKVPDIPTCILPTCVLCKGTHLATYRGCKVKKEVCKKRFPTKSDINQGNQANLIKPDKSFASALKGKTADSGINKSNPNSTVPHTTAKGTDYELVINELKRIIERQSAQIEKLMSVITQFLPSQQESQK